LLGLVCDRLVLYVGRLSAEKNPLGLLDAWAAVGTKVREGALLAVVGDGPEFDRLRLKAQATNLAGSVHLAGARSDVATWYRAADFYVICSSNEGLSNTMIEALASGLPVISTRVSGSSILVESPPAGLVVNVGDPVSLADAMGRLLTDPSMRTRLGKNARLAFEGRFSLETLSKQMISVYEELRERNAKRASA
jgi:glycosyltransferase involved in cell wall biosynthesis